MSSARRPLLTATAAGTLLGALWFVPNANATQDAPVRTDVTSHTTTQARAASTTGSDTSAASAASAASTASDTTASTDSTAEGDVDGARLANTGSFDTTPYVVGGTALLAMGAGFVVYSVRRERLGF